MSKGIVEILKESISTNKKPVHIVSAWAAENGSVLGEIAIEEKSNEITAIPKLWAIENSLHWVLDVDFGEDSMRMRTENAAENMNNARHLVLNLHKAEKSFNRSINLKRKNVPFLMNIFLKFFLVRKRLP